MKKIFVIFLLSILLFNSVIALDSIGTFKQTDCVRIPQTCATCTYINISSISYPNSTIAVNNTAMTSWGNGEYFYNFCNTSDTGRYDVRGKGDKGGTDTSFATYFIISPNGKETTTGESILYSLFIFILFGCFLILVYFILVLPNENDRDENNVVVGIVKLKYLRIFFIALSYPLILIILNLMNGLAVNYANLSIFAGIIGFIFESMIRVSWIFTFVIILWMFYLLIKDSNIKKNVDRLGRIRFNAR